MTVQISGPLFDEGGNALANMDCVVVAVDDLIGQSNGARVKRGVTATTNASGILTVDLEPGRHVLYVNPTANDSTSLTVRRFAELTVLTGKTSMTLQAALDTDVGDITASTLQLAQEAAQEAVNAAASLSARFFDTRAEAEAGDTGDAGHIYIGDLAYVYDASGTALTTGDGRKWSPDGDITVLHFGADRSGVSDCQPAFLAAISYVCNLDPGATFTTNVQGGGRLFVPAGVYKMDSIADYTETTSRKINFQLVGEGSFQTVIYASPTNSTGCIKVQVDGGNEGQFLARDITFIATAAENGSPLHFEVDPVGLSRQVRCLIDNIQVRPLDADGQWFSRGIVARGFYYPTVKDCTVSGPFGPEATSPASDAFADDSLLYRCDVGIDMVDCYDPIIMNCRVWSCDVGYDLSNTVTPGSEGALMLHSGCSRVRVGLRKISTGREPGFIVAFCHFNSRDYGMDFANLKDVDIVSNLTFNENSGKYGTGGIPHDVRLRGCQDVTIKNNRFQFAGDDRRIPILIDDTFDNTESIQEHRALRIDIKGNDFAVDGTFANCVRCLGVSDASLDRIVIRSFEQNTYDEDAIASPIALLNGGDPISWTSHRNGRTRINKTNAKEVVGWANDGDMRITNNGVPSGVTPDGGADNLVIDSTQSNFGINFLGEPTANANIFFGDSGSPSVGRIRYLFGSDTLQMQAGGGIAMNLNNTMTDDETAMVLLTRIGGVSVVKRVSVGAADSGGPGFRTLLVQN